MVGVSVGVAVNSLEVVVGVSVGVTGGSTGVLVGVSVAVAVGAIGVLVGMSVGVWVGVLVTDGTVSVVVSAKLSIMKPLSLIVESLKKKTASVTLA